MGLTLHTTYLSHDAWNQIIFRSLFCYIVIMCVSLLVPIASSSDLVMHNMRNKTQLNYHGVANDHSLPNCQLLNYRDCSCWESSVSREANKSQWKTRECWRSARQWGARESQPARTWSGSV
jgi:hypothetical protein